MASNTTTGAHAHTRKHRHQMVQNWCAHDLAPNGITHTHTCNIQYSHTAAYTHGYIKR